MEGIFLNGLTPEMRAVVQLMKPQDLPEMIAVLLSMEFDVLTKMVGKELRSGVRSHTQDSFGNNSGNRSNWKVKTIDTGQ